jgi:phosphinothricin acetyltransferase
MGEKRIEFREMEDKYLQDVKEIYNYYIENSTATFNYFPMNDEGMRSIVFFDEKPYKTFVILEQTGAEHAGAEPAGKMCGYVLLTKHKAREAFQITAEVTIYLHPDYTGKGLGSKALGFIEDYARQTTLHNLVATICGENTESIRLFESHGYEKCAHYKEVAFKMGRLLDLVSYQKIIS